MVYSMNVPQIIIIIVLSISVITDILVMHRSRREKDICYKIPFSLPSAASIDNNPTPGPPNIKTVDTCTQDSNADDCKTSPSSDTDINIATDTKNSTKSLSQNYPPVDDNTAS